MLPNSNLLVSRIWDFCKRSSVDGGNIRIRTPIGQQCDWKGYKAVRLHNLQAIAASFGGK
ncbi:hypothetical protein [Nostoc sp.]|uniref:hypothetical protein n=1 Tax=Nostoc sp. TaxID=1180 RepID=UPI003FA58A9D